MARNLLCPDCDKKTKTLAAKFNELYESKLGKSKGENLCDHCDKNIEVGDMCYASVLLPNKEHHNYEIQKPEAWMRDYLIPV